jgi:hypothetical protein
MYSVKLIQLTQSQPIGQNMHTHNKYPDGDQVLNIEVSKGLDVI